MLEANWDLNPDLLVYSIFKNHMMTITQLYCHISPHVLEEITNFLDILGRSSVSLTTPHDTWKGGRRKRVMSKLWPSLILNQRNHLLSVAHMNNTTWFNSTACFHMTQFIRTCIVLSCFRNNPIASPSTPFPHHQLSLPTTDYLCQKSWYPLCHYSWVILYFSDY